MLPRPLGLLAALLISAIVFSPPVYAAKPRVRKTAKTTSTAVAYSRAKLSRTTHSVVLTLLNLQKARRVTYELSYTASGIPQGVVGSITPGAAVGSETRDLYFGTCSHGVCTPHASIADAKLTVTTTLTSGARRIKIYRIRI